LLILFLKQDLKNATGDQKRNLQPSARHRFYHTDHIPSRHGQMFPAVREMGKMTLDLTAQSESHSFVGSTREDAEQGPDFTSVTKTGVRSKR